MRSEDIIQAWKNEDFRESLSEDQRAHLPVHPSGLVELDEEELAAINGGDDSYTRNIQCLPTTIWTITWTFAF